MEQVAQRVIKADDVNLNGQVSLGLNAAAAPKGSPPTDRTGAGAFIVEKNSQFMVVEITCSCGKKTYLKCDFA
jgi:hypothetical protein